MEQFECTSDSELQLEILNECISELFKSKINVAITHYDNAMTITTYSNSEEEIFEFEKSINSVIYKNKVLVDKIVTTKTVKPGVGEDIWASIDIYV